MCTYPSQSVKISIHSCTFLKNFPIWRLMPFQYIPFFLMLIDLVIYFVINSCANTPSAQSVSAERQEFCIWISCASSYGFKIPTPHPCRPFSEPCIHARRFAPSETPSSWNTDCPVGQECQPPEPAAGRGKSRNCCPEASRVVTGRWWYMQEPDFR